MRTEEHADDPVVDIIVDPADSVEIARRERRWRIARWLPFIIGAAFVLAAIALEHPALLGHDPVTDHNAPVLGGSAIFTGKTLVLWVAEIGYAFIIAGVVSMFIEANARREQNADIRQARQRISEDIVEAVYQIRHTPEYVRAVIGTCLESPLVREEYTVHYTIDPVPDNRVTELGHRDQFVLVETSVRYIARNVGSERGQFPTAYGIPVRSGVLKDLSFLKSLRVGDHSYSEAEIAALEIENEHNHVASERTYRFYIDLEPGDAVEVDLSVSLVKEYSDNDAFGFRRPTMGATIRVTDNVRRLKFGLTPRTSARWKTIREPESGKTGEWKILGPILPFDSAVIWWRSKEDDGSAQSTLPSPPPPTQVDRPSN